MLRFVGFWKLLSWASDAPVVGFEAPVSGIDAPVVGFKAKVKSSQATRNILLSLPQSSQSPSTLPHLASSSVAVTVAVAVAVPDLPLPRAYTGVCTPWHTLDAIRMS